VPGSSQGVTLEPLYKIHGDRHYVVYFDCFTPAQWKAREAEYRTEAERQAALAARTIDCVIPGEEQNERDHQLQSQGSGHGDFNGRKWRDSNNGWFSWDMKAQDDKPLELRVNYWGDDDGRIFDILVDGKRVATQELRHSRPGQFFDAVYRIPAELTKGKAKITIRFQAHTGSCAGGVFECRLMKAQ
jgi:hypothetical protein